MTFLSYLIVIIGGPIVLTITTLVLAFVVALILSWASIRFRVAVASFVSGTLGAICVWLFGNWIFEHVAHIQWASFHPNIAVAIALVIPFFNDLSRAQKVNAAAAALPAGLDEAQALVIGHYARIAGYVAGAALAFGWLASRVAA